MMKPLLAPALWFLLACPLTNMAADASIQPSAELISAARKSTSHATDTECQKPFETANWAENAIALTPILTTCLAENKGSSNVKSVCKTQLREASRRLIWLPLSLEEMYGKLMHEQRFKDGDIINPDSPGKVSKRGDDHRKLYDQTMAVFTKVLSVLPDNQPYRFQLYLTKDPNNERNAMAMPGGYVYVTLPLARRVLESKDGEAELTAVLAHEIGHVTKRHHTKSLQSQLVDIADGTKLLQSLLNGKVGDLGDLIRKGQQARHFVDFYSSLFSDQYSNQELESDACMTRLTLGNSLIDGYQAVSLFADRARKGKVADKSDGFFRKSHPHYEAREQTILKSAQKWRTEKLALTLASDPKKFIVAANFTKPGGADLPEQEGGIDGVLGTVKGWFTSSDSKPGTDSPPADTNSAGPSLGDLWGKTKGLFGSDSAKPAETATADKPASPDTPAAKSEGGWLDSLASKARSLPGAAASPGSTTPTADIGMP